jgi:hypothetical protein
MTLQVFSNEAKWLNILFYKRYYHYIASRNTYKGDRYDKGIKDKKKWEMDGDAKNNSPSDLNWTFPMITAQ